jgi:hypothetical protein
MHVYEHNTIPELVSLAQSLFCFLLLRLQWPGLRKDSQSCLEHDSMLGSPKTKKQLCRKP